jgi:hypothetical protein
MSTPDDSDEKGATGFPEPPGADPGDISEDAEPHHSLSNPASNPDPTEWPDPYERRDDPKGPGRERDGGGPGDRSTSEPHPTEDPEAGDQAQPPERDRLDD